MFGLTNDVSSTSLPVHRVAARRDRRPAAPEIATRPAPLSIVPGATGFYDLAPHVTGETSHFRMASGALPRGFSLSKDGILAWRNAPVGLPRSARVEAVGPGGVAALDLAIAVEARTSTLVVEGVAGAQPAGATLRWEQGQTFRHVAATTPYWEHWSDQTGLYGTRPRLASIDAVGGVATTALSDFDATFDLEGSVGYVAAAFRAAGPNVNPTGGVNAATGYLARAGAADFALFRYDSGTTAVTPLASVPFATAARTRYNLRVRAVGPRIRAKIWPVGAAEPANWMIDVVDAAYGAGWFGVLTSASRTSQRLYGLTATPGVVDAEPLASPALRADGAAALSELVVAPAEELVVDLGGLSSNVRDWSLAAPLPPGLYLADRRILGEAAATGDYALALTGDNGAGETVSVGGALRVVEGARRAPQILATTVVDRFAAGGFRVGLGTTHLAPGDPGYSRALLILTWARSATGVESLSVNGVAATRIATDASVSGQRMSAWLIPAPAGDSALVTMGYGAVSHFRMVAHSVLGLDPADPAAFDVAVLGVQGDAIAPPSAEIDVPDYGLMAWFAEAFDAQGLCDPILDGDVLTIADRTQWSGVRTSDAAVSVAGRVGLEPRLLADGEPVQPFAAGGRRAQLIAVALRGLDSRQTQLGVVPLAANRDGVIAPQSLVVGEAYTLDLEPLFYGFGGTITLALDPASDPLPAGLALSGRTISGVPTAAGSATIRLRARRGAEDVALPAVDLAVAATSQGNLATGLRRFGVAGGVTAIAGGERVAMATGAPYAYQTIATTPGRVYRARVHVDASGVAGADGLNLRALRRLYDETAFENANRGDYMAGWLADDWLAPGGSRVMEIVFEAVADVTHIAIGRFRQSEESLLAQESAAFSARGLRIEALPDALPLGSTGRARVDRVRTGGIEWIFDGVVEVARALDGSYLVAPGAALAAVTPTYRMGVYDGAHPSLDAWRGQPMPQHGIEVNWGSRGGLGNKLPQGMGGFGGDGPYAASRNADPHARALPTPLAVGSYSKAISARRAYFADRGNLLDDVRHLTVVPSLPEAGRLALRPPTATPSKALVYADELNVAAVTTLSLARPAAWGARASSDALAALADTNPEVRSPSGNKSGQPRRFGYWYGEQRFGLQAAALAELMFSDVAPADKTRIALAAAQLGLSLYGAQERPSAVWQSGGGGTQIAKYLVSMLDAVAPPAVQARLAAELGVARTVAQQVGVTDLFAEDRMIGAVDDRLIGRALTPYADPVGRPRIGYRPEHRGMPEWRENPNPSDPVNGSGANRWGDGYRGGSMNAILPVAVMARRLPALTARWSPASAHLDYVDRHVAFYTRSDAGPDAHKDRTLSPGFLALYAALRSGGEPVAVRMNGLAISQPPVGANVREYYVPVLRSWPVGAPTSLDLRGVEFYDARLAPGWPAAATPTAWAIGGVYAADGATPVAGGWVSVANGVLTATPPDAALYFVDVVGSNASGSATARIAIGTP